MSKQKTGLLMWLSNCVTRLFGVTAPANAAVVATKDTTADVAAVPADTLAAVPAEAFAGAPAKALAAVPADTTELHAQSHPMVPAILVEDLSVVSADEPAELAAPARQQEPVRLSLKLRSVGRINRQKRRSKTRSTVVAAKGAKATPRPVAQTRKAAKRTPDLYPMKRCSPVAKKPKLKVLAERPRARASAIIIPLPLTPRAVARLKLRKAA
jgi:hypothetical protein